MKPEELVHMYCTCVCPGTKTMCVWLMHLFVCDHEIVVIFTNIVCFFTKASVRYCTLNQKIEPHILSHFLPSALFISFFPFPALQDSLRLQDSQLTKLWISKNIKKESWLISARLCSHNRFWHEFCVRFPKSSHSYEWEIHPWLYNLPLKSAPSVDSSGFCVRFFCMEKYDLWTYPNTTLVPESLQYISHFIQK